MNKDNVLVQGKGCLDLVAGLFKELGLLKLGVTQL
jgi:hypothetical protein